MKTHVLKSLLIVLSITASALSQARGGGARGTPPKPKPERGAWWFTGGSPVSQDGRPDLTGVWFIGASGDLSKATVPGQELVLTPYGKQRYDTVDHAKDPNTQCLPPGPARMIMMAHPAMIVQRPDLVTILTESQRTFRLIYTDGRGHPDDVYEYPEWMGSSIGHWEGDTLVVDTVSINDKTWLDTAGHEHSDKLKMTERFRLADPNTLEHTVTYDDPVFFAKPFTTRKLFKRQVGDRIMDHSCLENEKDLINLVPTLGDAGRDR
ncbi:MAG TPA: hypothetical protein VE422_04515 [Terriglobia bacterium]|nr:hypothetical protein [Terriglobia bacterium]